MFLCKDPHNNNICLDYIFIKNKTFPFIFSNLTMIMVKDPMRMRKKQLLFNAYLAKSLNQEKAKLSQVNQVKPN